MSRHTTKTLTFHVYSDCPPDWPNEADKYRLFSSKNWNRTMGDRLGGESYWFVLRENHVPVLGVLGYLYTENENKLTDIASIIQDPPFKDQLDVPEEQFTRIRERYKNMAYYPNITFVYPGYECFLVGPANHQSEYIAYFITEITEWSKAMKVKNISFLYTDRTNVAFHKELLNHQFVQFPLATRAELKLKWNDFEGYLASLPVKRAREVKREIRVLIENNVQTRRIDTSSIDIHELVELRMANKKKYGLHLEKEKETKRLEQLISNYKDEISVFYTETKDKMICYCLYIKDEDVWHALLTGMDYSTSQSNLTYFQTVYYKPIEYAIKRGISTISFGHGASEAKVNRGCELTPVYGWMKSLD